MGNRPSCYIKAAWHTGRFNVVSLPHKEHTTMDNNTLCALGFALFGVITTIAILYVSE